MQGASRQEPARRSVLDNLGEEITGIALPVSICMLITVILVKILNPDGQESSSTMLIASVAYDESGNADDSAGKKFSGAILNALIFVAIITGMTILLFVLFYYGCYKIIYGYMAFAVFDIFFLITGILLLDLLNIGDVHPDAFSFFYILWNFSIVGMIGTLFAPIPLFMKQSYMVWVGIIVAYVFTWIPEWTSWVLLALMAIYDIVAVLVPGGPLKLIVDLAITRQQALPALVYESRPQGRYQGPEFWVRRAGHEAAGAGAAGVSEPSIPAGNYSGGGAGIPDGSTAGPSGGRDSDKPGKPGASGGSPVGENGESVQMSSSSMPHKSSDGWVNSAEPHHVPGRRPSQGGGPVAEGRLTDEGRLTQPLNDSRQAESEAGHSSNCSERPLLPTQQSTRSVVCDHRSVSMQDGGPRPSAASYTPLARLQGAACNAIAPQPSESVCAPSTADGASQVNLVTEDMRRDLDDRNQSNNTDNSTRNPNTQTASMGFVDDFDMPDGIKLGLGDFIFYAMLVGKAAMYDMMTVFAAYFGIIAGLGLTLLCLALFERALPALPFSIALGVLFYFLTRLCMEPFLVPMVENYVFY